MEKKKTERDTSRCNRETLLLRCIPIGRMTCRNERYRGETASWLNLEAGLLRVSRLCSPKTPRVSGTVKNTKRKTMVGRRASRFIHSSCIYTFVYFGAAGSGPANVCTERERERNEKRGSSCWRVLAAGATARACLGRERGKRPPSEREHMPGGGKGFESVFCWFRFSGYFVFVLCVCC